MPRRKQKTNPSKVTEIETEWGTHYQGPFEELPQIQRDRHTLTHYRSQIVDGVLNGYSKAARRVLDRFVQSGGKIEEFADVAKAAKWSVEKPKAVELQREISSPDLQQPSAKAIGKPITLRTDLQNLDHPTVRFLAIREAVIPEGATFLICGGASALAQFGEEGQLQLAPLKITDKDGKEASWLEAGKTMQSFSSHLYGPHPNDRQRDGTATCLDWIKSKSSYAKAQTKGGFYLTSQTDFDRETLLTTMGKRTALGLPELYLEWDDISEAEQLKRIDWLKGLGFSLTVVSSGGKSVHGHIHLDSVASFADAFPVLKLLTALAGSDPAVVSKARRMRLPGALRPIQHRLRGGASTSEQRLIETAEHCYDLAEVRRVLEAEAKQRGWKVDHLETRWSEYREALSELPDSWPSADRAWTMDEAMAIAWSQARGNGGTDGEFDPPVEWRRDETELGWKIRHAEAKLFEKHGLADAFELVALKGTLIEKQDRRGWPGFEFGFAETAEGAQGQSPFSQVRESGVYSGNSLRLFEESKHFYCFASQRKGGLGEWAAHWCPYRVARPASPTPEEQTLIGLWLWELAGLDRQKFDSTLNSKEDLDKELRAEQLKRFENAKRDRLELREVLPNSVAGLLSTRAKAFPIDELAMLPPFLAASASILGKRYRTKVKEGYTEPMVFWIGRVGGASELKTPVSKQVLTPLVKWDEAGVKIEREMKAQQEHLSKEEQEEVPTARQRIGSDLTFEGMAKSLTNPMTYGMVMARDELAAWIGSMDAYRKAGASKDRPQWLSMWSGDGIDITRAGADRLIVSETAVSVYGSIQQDTLGSILNGEDAASRGGDGFWSRFLWVIPPYVFPAANRDESDITPELTRIYSALDQITGEIEVELSKDAWHVYAKAADEFSREAAQCGGVRSPYLGKLRGYLVRFAGWIHAIEHAALISKPGAKGSMNKIDLEISAETMERAVRMAQYFLNSFDTLAPQIGLSDIPAAVAKVIDLGDRKEKVTARDVMRRRWAPNAEAAKKLLLSIVSDYSRGRIVPAPRADQVWWSAS